jgi:hypothetical protein
MAGHACSGNADPAITKSRTEGALNAAGKCSASTTTDPVTEDERSPGDNAAVSPAGKFGSLKMTVATSGGSLAEVCANALNDVTNEASTTMKTRRRMGLPERLDE